MQDFPDETISEIIGHLNFRAVNSFARSCSRHARLVAKSAVQIADKHIEHGDTIHCQNSVSHVINIYVGRLPNGVNHGRVEFREAGRLIFRVTYILGKPTYWRTMSFGSFRWGRVSSPYYVQSWDDDDFLGAEVCVNLSNNFIISCEKYSRQTIYGSSHTFDIVSPAPFIADGDINLAKIKKWGDRVLHHMRAIWPDVEPIEHKIKTFDNEPEITKAIFEHCPGIEVMFA